MDTEQDKPAHLIANAHRVPPNVHAPKPAGGSIGVVGMGLGRFRVMSEHEHRLEWERICRTHGR